MSSTAGRRLIEAERLLRGGMKLLTGLDLRTADFKEGWWLKVKMTDTQAIGFLLIYKAWETLREGGEDEG